MDPKALGNISPTKLEAARLCEARLMGRLNQLGEAEWDEEQGEGAMMGTLAHAAAKIWYRPNEKWLERVIQGGENWESLAAQAQTVLQNVERQYPAAEGEDEKHKAVRLEAIRKAKNAAEEKIAELGLLKHPFTDPDYVFRLAITDVARSDGRNEVPKEITSLNEARILFDAIILHYKRETLNVVFAERRYKGQIANGVPVHLIIDLGVDRGDGRLEIIDFKTGWITMSTEEMYQKDQVIMNLLATSRYDATLSRFKTKSFTYFWTRSGFETGPVSVTVERLIDYEHYLAVTYQHLLDLKDPSESTNRFCVGCPRRTRCDAFRELIDEAMNFKSPPLEADEAKAAAEKEVAEVDDESMMQQYDRLRAQVKLLEGRQKMLGGVLKRRMEKTGVKAVETPTFKAVVRQNKSDAFDTGTVLALCIAKGIDPTTVLTVGTKDKVEETFGKDPEAMRTLGMTMRRGCASPWVDIRQVSQKPAKKSKKAKAGETTEPVSDQQGVGA